MKTGSFKTSWKTKEIDLTRWIHQWQQDIIESVLSITYWQFWNPKVCTSSKEHHFLEFLPFIHAQRLQWHELFRSKWQESFTATKDLLVVNGLEAFTCTRPPNNVAIKNKWQESFTATKELLVVNGLEAFIYTRPPNNVAMQKNALQFHKLNNHINSWLIRRFVEVYASRLIFLHAQCLPHIGCSIHCVCRSEACQIWPCNR